MLDRNELQRQDRERQARLHQGIARSQIEVQNLHGPSLDLVSEACAHRAEHGRGRLHPDEANLLAERADEGRHAVPEAAPQVDDPRAGTNESLPDVEHQRAGIGLDQSDQ